MTSEKTSKRNGEVMRTHLAIANAQALLESLKQSLQEYIPLTELATAAAHATINVVIAAGKVDRYL